jgi:hypothetical protein
LLPFSYPGGLAWSGVCDKKAMVAFTKALLSAMVITVSEAINCMKLDEGYDTTSQVQYCDGADMYNGKDCMSCCIPAPRCFGYMMKGEGTCDAGMEYDNSKRGSSVSGGMSAYSSTCCKKATVLDNTCQDGTIVAKVPDVATKGQCGDVLYALDPAKVNNAAKADGTDWKAQCCSKKAKCTSVTCPAGMKDAADKATLECTGTQCNLGECCKADTTKCYGFAATCPASKFRDGSKVGTAATSADFETNCCSDRAKCNEFQNVNLDEVGGSTQQHAATLSLLLPVVAAMGNQF